MTAHEMSIRSYIGMLHNLRLPAMIFDKQMKLVGTNMAFQALFQVRETDLIAGGAEDFFKHDLWDKLQCLPDEGEDQSSTAGQLVEVEMEREGKFYKLTLAPIKDKDAFVIGYLLFFIDMTREKMLEQVRADFTSMIVHDLRSPLTAVMGNLELLFIEFEENCDPDTRELFQDSIDQSQRLLNMINDLLDISKIESGKFTLVKEQVDPLEIIKYSVRSMEPLADRENIALELTLDQDLSHIHADKDKLIQVLINLISNAIKFSGPGDLVQIHAREIHNGNGPSLLISISDTGEGIKAENLLKLFEKYQQVGKKKQRLIKGTGLGLFIVKELIEAHDGQVQVVSHFGNGSCFSLLLPIIAPPT
ncbi:PAS domain-containing protein [bacterium]|nr:PAS domain-containing protein [bacterium]